MSKTEIPKYILDDAAQLSPEAFNAKRHTIKAKQVIERTLLFQIVKGELRLILVER